MLLELCSTDFNWVQKSIELKLKIPQLTLAKIAQMGRREIVNTRSEQYSPWVKDSIPVSGNLFAEFILM